MLHRNDKQEQAPRVRVLLVLLGALMVVLSQGAGAQLPEPHRFVETFETTDYMGPATTAFWDTTTGVLTQPMAAVRLDTLPLDGMGQSIHVDGRYAYLAMASRGLRVIDTSDPTTPVIVETYSMGSTSPVRKVAVDGDIAVIAWTERGSLSGYYRVLDISDPTDTSLLDSGVRGDVIENMVMEGDLCLMASGDAGLALVDLTDPTNAISYIHTMTGLAHDVALQRCHAYVAWDDHLEVVYVADPAAPVQLGLLSLPGARKVAVSGHHAFVLTTDELCIIDISDPRTPALVTAVPAAGASNIEVEGDWAYVSAGDDGLHVYDISDPAAPLLLASLDTGGRVEDCDLIGNLLHVATWTGGLAIYEIAELLTPPELVDSFTIADDVTDVDVAGDLALVTTFGAAGADQGNLLIFDNSDPTAMTLLGEYDGFPVYNKAVAVAIDGDRAYVLTDYEDPTYGNHSSALHTIDISDPTNPHETDSIGFAANAEARTLTVRGRYAYCGCRTSGVSWGVIVIDLRYPDFLAVAGHGPTLDRDVYDIDLVGDAMYVSEPTGSSSERLQAMDITDPTAPAAAWSGYLTYGINRTGVIGNYLSTTGLTYYVFDITDPLNPVYANSIYAPGVDYRSMAPAGRYMTVDTNTGFALVDCNAPASPVLLSPTLHTGNIREIEVAGDYAYGAANRFYSGSFTGLHVFRLFERRPPSSANRGSSLTIDALALNVHAARIIVEDQGQTHYSLTADGGVHWEVVTPGADWHVFQYPGSDLRWQVYMYESEWEPWPVVETVTVEWHHTDVAAAGTPPARYALQGGAPNPFNARTTISFDVPTGGGEVTLDIYNLRGQLVRRLVNGHQDEGTRRVPWDGKDENGRQLAGGTYYCRMTAAGCEETTKLTLVP